MDTLLDLIVMASRWCRTSLSEIALAVMATLLVVCSPALNAWLQRRISHLHFIFRTLIFILVCTFGYGLGIIYLTPQLARGLTYFNDFTLAPVLLLIFITLGVLAERR